VCVQRPRIVLRRSACGKDGKWKDKLEKCLQTDDRIVLLALGNVRYEVLSCLNKRKDIEILKLEARQMKKRDKGTGLKATVRSRRKPDNLQKM
jgi:hypothetical protein